MRMRMRTRNSRPTTLNKRAKKAKNACLLLPRETKTTASSIPHTEHNLITLFVWYLNPPCPALSSRTKEMGALASHGSCELTAGASG
jgi:hypothetical protein